MMIDSETYYEEYLEGKTAEEIQTEIRSLKKEIGHLKNTMEHPDYPYTVHICPDESVRMSCSRDYLERAKKALTDAGAEYRPSKAELLAAEFDENISAIQTIKLTVGSCFEGLKTYTINLDGENLHVHAGHSFDENQCGEYLLPLYPKTREDLLYEIKGMHIGEWRHYYDTERFGITVLDGTQWELKITYSNGHRPVSFAGSNAYPYNFRKLKELFGIDDEMEEDYEDDEKE